jgi:chromosome partitioning protein
MGQRLYGGGHFSASHIEKIFQLDISKSSLLNYEERGVIPRAERLLRGKSAYRAWRVADLPRIGAELGFLKRPQQPKVVSVFSLKGGTGKTTFAFQFARALALHDVRTLVIGLDAQESVTQTLNRAADAAAHDPVGLFHVLAEEAALEQAVLPTDLSGLHYIPETIELSVLDRLLKSRVRKEYIILEKVVQPLVASRRYDVIVFDCNPAWTDTVTGALAATDILVSPLGCDINSLKAAKIFVDLLAEFQDEMRHAFERFFLVPSLAENNKLSQQILAKYRLNYEDLCTVAAIRRAVSVQEASVLGQSLMEVGFSSPVYQDFVGVFKEVNSAMLEDTDALVAAPHRGESAQAEMA